MNSYTGYFVWKSSIVSPFGPVKKAIVAAIEPS
jgi:hypothetical protein